MCQVKQEIYTISLSLARKYLPGKQCDNHRIICPMIENIRVIGKM